MVMIVKAAEEYAGLHSLGRYDEAQAAAKDIQWSKVNPSLFAQCFTGRAHNQTHCDLCLSSSHTTQDCPLGNTSFSGTTTRLQSVEVSLLAISNNLQGTHRTPQRKPTGLCWAWNGGSCTHYPNMLEPIARDPIQRVDALSEVMLRRGVAMPSELTLVLIRKGLKSYPCCGDVDIDQLETYGY